MHCFWQRAATASLLVLLGGRAWAQAPTTRPYVVSPIVGEVIDRQEKATYGLFPYYAADNFEEARFEQALAPDSAISLRTRLRDGRTVSRPFTAAEVTAVRETIGNRARELGTAGVAPAAEDKVSEIIGQVYAADLRSGASFVGTLTAASPEALEFDTKDLGHVRVPRANLRQLQALSPQQKRLGWDPVGNGTRVFFAPTARNLRRGEGYVQSINVLLLGANYGLTNNLSVGALALLPVGGAGTGLIALTPKFSAPIKEKFHLGAGALISRAFGTTFGVGYGVGTLGTADQNLSLGLGYAFAEGEASSTPVVVVGGATRVSRRISLLNETYVASGGFFGLFGLRVAGPQFSGSLGFAYLSEVNFIFPAYAEAAYRFGRVK